MTDENYRHLRDIWTDMGSYPELRKKVYSVYASEDENHRVNLMINSDGSITIEERFRDTINFIYTVRNQWMEAFLEILTDPNSWDFDIKLDKNKSGYEVKNGSPEKVEFEGKTPEETDYVEENQET